VGSFDKFTCTIGDLTNLATQAEPAQLPHPEEPPQAASRRTHHDCPIFLGNSVTGAVFPIAVFPADQAAETGLARKLPNR
jgi:hypothetical protein